MVPRSLLLMVIVALAGISSEEARADIPPTGSQECEGKEAGAACRIQGVPGQCVATTCASARPRCEGEDCPPGANDSSYPCTLCQPTAAASKGGSGCGCEAAGGGGAAWLAAAFMLASMLGLRRRFRASDRTTRLDA